MSIANVLLGAIPTQAPAQPSAPTSPVTRQRPLLGVIRWDGYNGGHFTQNQELPFLKAPEHHWRVPWFARRTGDPEAPLSFNPEFSQDVIQQVTDQEIRYAASAGFDFFAFCHFRKDKGDGWSLRNNLQAYLDSPLKPEIDFALICIGAHVGAGTGKPESPETTRDDWRAYVGEYIELMREPTYQTVLDGRPLWGIFGPSDLATNLGDDEHAVGELKLAVQYLRDEVKAAGLLNPYLVGMHAGGIWAAKYVDEAGLDAVSAYRGAFGGTVEGPPFADLWGSIRRDFLESPGMGGGRKVIVPMLSGADQSPRHPDVPKYQEPEPGDLAKLLHSAFDYAAENPEQCEAEAAWIYAWNEHSEGGFICPLMGEEPNYTPVTAQLDDCSRGIKNWVSPAVRDSAGVPLANYTFGDRDPSLDSVATAAEAGPLEVRNGVEIVAGNNPRTGRRGLCLKLGDLGSCTFAIEGGHALTALSFAYRSGGGAASLRVGDWEAEIELAATGEGWSEVMVALPEVAGPAAVSIELRAGAVLLDDVRLFGRPN